MTRPRPPITESVSLPADSVITLAELLTELDRFLRGSDSVVSDLADVMHRGGHPHPAFAAYQESTTTTRSRLFWQSTAPLPCP
jgi:hypothetical protein